MKEGRSLVPMWAAVYTEADGAQYVAVEDAARIADVPPDTVRRWVAAGRVAATQRNGGLPPLLLVSLCDVRQIASVRGASRAPFPPGIDPTEEPEAAR
jgi:hypothetical protein